MIINPINQADYIGATASALCVIHCILTPFLFIAQSCSSVGCCESSPIWWKAIDFIFIGITFFAVYQSGQQTTKSIVKYTLYLLWGLLTLLVLNGYLNIINIPEWWKYIVAIGLIGLHIYNQKFCKCLGETCCVEKA